jgi:nephrocystin-3
MGAGSSIVGHDPNVINHLKQVWDESKLGIPKHLMQSSTSNTTQYKTVRVFVSSTFKDFFAEREILVKSVFPRLREWCEKRKLLLVEVDLRWGVPRESSSERILRACLGEIDRCREENESPYFINMLGHRYGWVPEPSMVPEDVHSEYQWIDGASVTHMEIAHAVLRQPNPKALFLIRDDSYLYSLPESSMMDFVEKDWRMKASLDLLKHELRTRYGRSGNVVDYSPTPYGIDSSSGQDKVKFKNLEHFATSVFDFLQREMSLQYPIEDVGAAEDGIDAMQRRLECGQDSFMHISSKNITGRDEEMGQILQYLYAPWPEDIESCDCVPCPIFPLLLYSDRSGVGMSALMSAAALAEADNRLSTGNGSCTNIIFFHSLQCSNGINAAESPTVLLMRLCLALGDAEIRQEVASMMLSECHDDKLRQNSLQGTFCGMLRTKKYSAEVSASTPAWIFLDAVHEVQGDTLPASFVVDLFPFPMPPELRVVMSSDHESVLNTFIARIPPALSSANVFHVLPVTDDVVKIIIKRNFGDFNKSLDDNQLAHLLENPGSKNMTWLSLACEELRVFGVFETLTEYIAALPSTVTGLVNLYLQRILAALAGIQDGRIMAFVDAAIRFLIASRSGIIETELIDLLNMSLYVHSDGSLSVVSTCEDSQPQSMTYEDWAHVYVLIKLFLKTVVPQYSDSFQSYKPRYVIKNYTVRKVLENHVLGGARSIDDAVMPFNRKIANYLEHSSDSIRIAEEYPHQLLQCKDYAKLKAFMKSPTFRLVRFKERLSIVNTMRCIHVMVYPPNDEPANETMCINCSMKCTFNPARFNKMSCFVCGEEVFSQSMMMGGKVSFRSHAGEIPARMCRLHNMRAYQQKGPAAMRMNCVVCKLPTMPGTATPAVLCRQCSLLRNRCCFVRES